MSGFKSNYNKHYIDVGLYSFKDSAEYIICFTELSAHTNQFCVNWKENFFSNGKSYFTEQLLKFAYFWK